MIEILILIAVLAGFSETAKRRGVAGWPYMVVGGVGWLFGRLLGATLAGPGPALLISWAWVGLTYASIFVIGGGGRRMESSWQCPECQFFNPPSTIVCPCGYEPIIPLVH